MHIEMASSWTHKNTFGVIRYENKIKNHKNHKNDIFKIIINDDYGNHK